ncbi:RNA12 protein-domain-containing protein [Mycena amicta]|nr:RNA12 protein-domain-containing protein [Mycena amicta]
MLRRRLHVGGRTSIRRYTDSTTPSTLHRGQIFIDALPVSYNFAQHLTIQKFVQIFRQDDILEALRARLANVKAHGFSIVDMKPYSKDGGVFVTFEYSASDPEAALKNIEKELKNEASQHGGLPSWGRSGSHAWLVKGSPWIEDMWRYSSQFLNVYFEGPDVSEERVYNLLRPYGHIVNMLQPTSFPPGTRRFITVLYRDGRFASRARNALHGIELQNVDSPPTKLHILYTSHFSQHERPRIVDWLTNHPRISLPLLFFIFDPIRSLMVKAKMNDWFVIQESRIYRWLRAKSVELRIIDPEPEANAEEEVWKERKRAEKDTRAYLTDWPTTVAFVHGPQGSGKTHMLTTVLAESKRTVVTIDCRQLQDATSDVQVINSLARQIGYWPVFSFVNSLNHIVDLVSVGIMGSKANLSSSNSLPEQVRSMLLVVRSAIKSVGGSQQREVQRQVRRAVQEEELAKANATKMERIKRGGNGVMAELGVGDERFEDAADFFLSSVDQEAEVERQRYAANREKGKAELEAVSSLPVVVIRNFDTRGLNREEIFDVMAEWAASLVEQQVRRVLFGSTCSYSLRKLAHVVVVTDNPLPSRPLQTIALSDADAPSALAFVKRKLKDAHINLDYTQEQVASVERLGGRASDLESLIYKVRNGATVGEAVEDIVSRGVSELQKNAFADDAEDAKNLPWSREQAWSLFKVLSTKAEVPYYDTLLDFPFKGDESALRSLEHAEIISISTHNGRPSAIRPGRPVYKYVFDRLVSDPIFKATQDIAFNEKLISSYESAIKSCEQELLPLKEIGLQRHWLWGGGNSAASARARYLSSRMHAATAKIEVLEKRNVELKKVLTKGG